MTPFGLITDTDEFQIVSDDLGSPVVVVNAANVTVEQEVKYDEFGQILSDTNPGFTPFGYLMCELFIS